MSRVALILHGGRDDAVALATDITSWLEVRGHQVVREADRPDDDGHQRSEGGGLLVGAEADRALDLVVAIGGDGTVLRAARRGLEADAAILGINLGQLGYLAEVEPSGWQAALEGFLAGRHRIEARMLVQGSIEGQPPLPPALNEVVIEKPSSGHSIHLGVRIDGEFFTSYVADGLILATPTGSTAYSLSARGPIVAPSHRAMLVTPVSPHTLFDRSLVLGPESSVEVDVMGDQPATVSVDGQACSTLEPGQSVTVRAISRPARFVTFGGRAFHQVLKAKFGLNDR